MHASLGYSTADAALLNKTCLVAEGLNVPTLQKCNKVNLEQRTVERMPLNLTLV